MFWLLKSDSISYILFSGGWAFPSIMHCLVENATYACFLSFRDIYSLLITFTFELFSRWWRGDGGKHGPIEYYSQQRRTRRTESLDSVASAMSLIDVNQWLAYGQVWLTDWFSLQCGITCDIDRDHRITDYQIMDCELLIFERTILQRTSLRINVCYLYLDILI